MVIVGIRSLILYYKMCVYIWNFPHLSVLKVRKYAWYWGLFAVSLGEQPFTSYDFLEGNNLSEFLVAE